MRRSTFRACALIAALSLRVFAADIVALPEPGHMTTIAPARVESLPGKATQAIDDALDKTLVSVARGTPLQKVLADIADAAKVGMTVQWDTLEETGAIRRSMPVDVVLVQVSARAALRTVLASSSAATELAFVTDGSQVIVSTHENLRWRFKATHVYDIGMLTADFEPGSPQAADIQMGLARVITSAVEENSWRDNGGTLGSIEILNNSLVINQAYDIMPTVDQVVEVFLKNPRKTTRSYDIRDLLKDAPQPDALDHGKLDDLINTIETTCGRDTWRDRGGQTSSIAPFEGKLYVTTTPAVHRQIEALLAMMRKKD